MQEIGPDGVAEFKRRKAEYDKSYRRLNRERRRILATKWAMSEVGRKQRKAYYENVLRVKDKRKRRILLTEVERREKSKAACLSYYYRNKQKLRQRSKDYNRTHREEVRDQRRAHYVLNRVTIMQRNNEYARRRMRADPVYRMQCRVWSRMYELIRRKCGRKRRIEIEEMIGCTSDQLKKHLECKFAEGMSWANYGRTGWHVDHCVPLSHFDMSDASEMMKAVNWRNLKPMWGNENSRKGNRYAEPMHEAT